MMENAMHVDTERKMIVKIAIDMKGRITSNSDVYKISTIHFRINKNAISMGVKIFNNNDISWLTNSDIRLGEWLFDAIRG